MNLDSVKILMKALRNYLEFHQNWLNDLQQDLEREKTKLAQFDQTEVQEGMRALEELFNG